jgi:hypothetical protein
VGHRNHVKQKRNPNPQINPALNFVRKARKGAGKWGFANTKKRNAQWI